jgi:hypothetical protein
MQWKDQPAQNNPVKKIRKDKGRTLTSDNFPLSRVMPKASVEILSQHQTIINGRESLHAERRTSSIFQTMPILGLSQEDAQCCISKLGEYWFQSRERTYARIYRCYLNGQKPTARCFQVLTIACGNY